MLILQVQQRIGVQSTISQKNKNTMKNFKNIVSALLFLFILQSCNDKNKMQNPQSENEKQNNYSTSEEAVKKAKLDLTELLNNKTYNLKIDAAALERSQAQPAIKTFEVDFDRLLSANDTSIASLSRDSKKMNTPFLDGNQIVAVITTSQTKKGWQLDELTNMNLASDLTEIKTQINNMEAQIALYEVPNINTTIYEVNVEGRKLYFTKTDGLSLQIEESEGNVLQKIKADAQLFQRKYGNILRKRKLVR